MPNGPNGVDDPSTWKIERRRGFSVADTTAAELGASLQQARSRSTMDCTVDAAAAEKGPVRRIDDCIDPLSDDVTQHNFKFHRPHHPNPRTEPRTVAPLSTSSL
jgi:hypothetical protein